MTPTCVFCGTAPGVQAHHLSGRPAGDRPHFDPDLTFPVCGRCNKLRDHVWRSARLYELTDPVRTRLLRAACEFDAVADRGHPIVLRPTQDRALARLLRDAAHVTN